MPICQPAAPLFITLYKATVAVSKALQGFSHAPVVKMNGRCVTKRYGLQWKESQTQLGGRLKLLGCTFNLGTVHMKSEHVIKAVVF